MAEVANPRFLRPLSAPDADIGQAIAFGPERPLALDGGRTLSPFTVAYMTYGTLNAAKSNVVLVCHALTGDQFVGQCRIRSPASRAGGRPWWDRASRSTPTASS